MYLCGCKSACSLGDCSYSQLLVQQLSEYIVRKAPELKGFSAQNLWRMKQFL